MKKIFLLLLFVLTSVVVQGRDATEFFARILPDRETVYAGDSMLVSVVLYSSLPIAQAECTTDFDVKGNCRIRKISINRDATASRVRENGRIYYTLVWAQYVVAPERVGKFSIPAQKFKAVLQQVVRMPSMFDQMFGAQPEYREVKTSGSAPSFAFEAKEKPLRSTQEIMRSGGTVM